MRQQAQRGDLGPGSTIHDPETMEPFLMNIAGASDVWLYVASNGAVTTGRRNADHAVFPYDTEDKLVDSVGHTGGFTTLQASPASGAAGGSSPRPHPWHPFDANALHLDGARHLHKTDLGDALTFVETHESEGLSFSVTWRSSSEFGAVRECRLRETSGVARRVEVVDGVLNLLPPGASVVVQRNLSVLLDAYKVTDVDPATGLATACLNSLLTDHAEPAESLAATVAWQVGLDAREHLLSTRPLTALRRGETPPGQRQVRGERSAYLVRATVDLEPFGEATWTTVVDTDVDTAAAADLCELLRDPAVAADRLRDGLRADRDRLCGLVAAADGLQCTGDPAASAHHQANVLFNIMRGGVFTDGYTVRPEDLRDFVATRNTRAAARLAESLPSDLHGEASILRLREWAEGTGDPDLLRLLREYLPLTFGRRHGDPSRPWNKFEIVVTGPDGRPRSDYQGNWRDIFQNWEALAWSFPRYLTSMISTFLDATTLDGYNPYRISRAGVDWEVPDPGDPWANIGYWSDHQVVYLLALLETSDAFEPGRVAQLMHERVFTSADVPYRLADFDQMLLDPHETIDFDTEAHQAALERRRRIGGDGMLVHDDEGELVRSTLAEKLVLLLCAKLVNLVPGGGIWMNTQRPEWNDANNALVGRGLSVVTVAYLRRYLVYLGELVRADAGGIDVSVEVADLVTRVSAVLDDAETRPGEDDRPRQARIVVEELGRAGSQYRSAVYLGRSKGRTELSSDQVLTLVRVALDHCEATLAANRRSDGLYHSYNTMLITDEEVRVQRLPVMLEGQVAVLASGLLDAAAARELLVALRDSALYRADQHSYQLYPDAEVAAFLERNTLPDRADDLELLTALAAAGDRRLAVRDSRGAWHFAAGLRNAKDLTARLDELAADDELAALVEQDRGAVAELFEDVFDHASFIGRSGSFFAFEGLGSIYWHMVSKLLLGVQRSALAADGDHPASAPLLRAYDDVRQGLGYCKDPRTYGAFPTDPYSHTPAGRGARQPGMTGQVKEEVITRFAELGVRCEEGRIVADPRLVRPEEWLAQPSTFAYLDVDGRARSRELPAGSYAFTWCQVPFEVRQGSETGWSVEWAGGRDEHVAGDRLPAAACEAIFARSGAVAAVRLQLAGAAATRKADAPAQGDAR